MWGLDKNKNSSWRVVRKEKDCILRFPAFNSSGELESRFSLGVCLRPWSSERWRVDLALPAGYGRTHPGANPSFVPLPETLKTSFPFGKWFAVSRFGWARCPGMQDFDHRPEVEYLRNLWCSGSYAAVLGSDFNVQAVSKIELEGGDWANAISDVRLWPSGEDLIVSFVPYFFYDTHHALVAKLYASSVDGNLKVWVDRREVRRAESCKHPQDYAKKNFGFLRSGLDIFVLDKIFPTAVSLVNLSVLDGALEPEMLRSNHTHSYGTTHVAPFCMESVVTGSESNYSPWHSCRGQSKETFLHNGPSPVWIDEKQFFLGIGHLARGKRRSHLLRFLPDHYTHQFFTISASPPFRLLALSPEFCFSSAQDPSDCENIQYASTLLRDGDDLLVAYGIEDCDSYIQRFHLSDILDSMLNVSDEIGVFHTQRGL